MIHLNYFKFGLKEDRRFAVDGRYSQDKRKSKYFGNSSLMFPTDHPGILATIGPKSSTPSSVQKISQYTNYFRLNGSHSSIDWHTKVSKSIRKASSKTKILLDIPGIKPRTNNSLPISIKKNECINFYFGPKEVKNNIRQVELTKPLPNITSVLKSFSLSDGLYEFDFFDQKENSVCGRSRTKFQLLPRKGLNIPGSIYDNDLQLEFYLDFLSQVGKLDFDAIGLSFIQDSKTLKIIRNKFPDKLLVAKIENKSGVENVEQIVRFSDAIMIDRGDLLAEVGIENFYKSILKICIATKSYGLPLIMATENLTSMQQSMQPTKGEIMALQHSIELGSDLIMLSDETATSNYFLNTIGWLNRFLKL